MKNYPNQIQITPVPVMSSFILTLFSCQSFASSAYLGYVNDQQEIQIVQDSVTLSPTGLQGNLSFDLTKAWSICTNYSESSGEHVNQMGTSGKLNSKTWALGVNYYLDEWWFSTSYIKWDNQVTNYRMNERELSSLDSNGPSLSLSVGYDYIINDWLVGTQLSLSHSQIKQVNQLFMRDTSGIQTITISQEDSDITSMYAGLSVTKVLNLGKKDLYLGANIGRNYQAEESVIGQLEGDNNLSNRRIRRIGNNLAATSSLDVGTENYSQIGLFVAYAITESVSLDFDFQSNFVDQQHYQSWSAGMSYAF